MRKPNTDQIIEPPEEATQAENSPDTLVILITSLVALVLIGAGLLWYFGYIFAG